MSELPGPTTPSPFAPDVVAAVQRHMNQDHQADSLLICRELGGAAAATDVTMVGLDEQGIVLLAVQPDGQVTVRIPWGVRPADRGAIRAEIVRLYQEACARREARLSSGP